MTAYLRVLVLICSLLAAFAAEGRAEKRVALVIGNGSYQNTVPLKNPRNDAAAVSDALEKLDFDVVLGVDLDDTSLRKLAREFSRKIEDADVALLFYAGHGLQVNNRNYLLPVNAALKQELDLEFETVPLDLILTQMERKQRVNIVLLDACRNNPLTDDLARSMGTRSVSLGRGLARVETGVGTYVGFATQPGNVALDGEGEHSPFARALLDNIAKPNLDIETLMRQVREQVIKATNGKQVPWGNSSLVGRGFEFNPTSRPVETGPKEQDQAPPKLAPVTSVTDQTNVEIAFWNSIKDTNDPAMLEAYLSEYPNGRFARLADIMLENLTDKAIAKKDAPQQPVKAGPQKLAAADPQRQIAIEARDEAPTAPAATELPKKEPAVEQKAEQAPPEPVLQQQAAVEPKDVPAEAPVQQSSDAEEAGYFAAVKGSGDIPLIESYLKRYPKGRFVKEAKALIVQIKGKAAAIAVPDKADDAGPQSIVKTKPVKKQPVIKEKRKPVIIEKKPVREKRKPVVVEVVKTPKPVVAPKRAGDDCGWCSFGGGGFTDTHFCGAEYRKYKALRKCGPVNQ